MIQVRMAGPARPHLPLGKSLREGIDLVGEVDEAFSSDRWAIVDSGREHATWLLYDGAALRHCCRLLYEIEVAAAAGLELSVRMLGRAHMEAWLVALYIHFGGCEALLKVAQDARHSLEGIELEARQFDQRLAAEKTAARRSGRKVAKANSGIAQWNEKNPDVPPKPLLDEPYVPQLSPGRPRPDQPDRRLRPARGLRPQRVRDRRCPDQVGSGEGLQP